MSNQNKTNKIIFSIIIPVYNSENYLPRTFASLENINYPNKDEYEIIFVNDGSIDNSQKMIRQYANRNSNMKFINNPHKGQVDTRGDGIKNASGKYILIPDADDEIYPNILTECKKIIDSHAPDLIIFNNTLVESEKESGYGFPYIEKFYSQSEMRDEIFPSIFTFEWFLNSWRCCFKTELLKKTYCWGEKFDICGDMVFTYNTIYRANNCFILKEILYKYYVYNDGAITSSNKYNIQNYCKCGKYIFESFALEEKYITQQVTKYFTYHIVDLLLKKDISDYDNRDIKDLSKYFRTYTKLGLKYTFAMWTVKKLLQLGKANWVKKISKFCIKKNLLSLNVRI